MIIEYSDLQGIALRAVSGEKLGEVDFAVFNGKEATLMGFQIVHRKIIKKFSGVYFSDLIDITKDEIVIEDQKILKPNLQDLDKTYKNFGPVVGVVATTESGKRIGKVADLYIDLTTGGIIRFYIKNLLQERIIPKEYLVAITPDRIVFKDIVGTPKFNEASTQAVQG